MIKRLLLCGVLICNTAYADTNSAEITNATMNALPNCLHYQVKGTCYWLSNGSIITTPYVAHYLPDLVVSIFNKPDDDPWLEMKISIDQAGKEAEQEIVYQLTNDYAGQGQHSFAQSNEQNVFFKEAEVIGDPALSLLQKEVNVLLLPSTATPLEPYYQSMLDTAMWRGLLVGSTSTVEEDYAMIADVVHHVGTFPIDWGGVYPHEGKVDSSNDAKAAAVIAQRSADLITSSDLTHIIGHIYKPLSTNCGQECNASPIQENSPDTEFQMVYPVVDDTCDYFGKTMDYGDDIETKTDGSYVWVVWRLYSGCIAGGGKFLGKTIF